MAYATKAVLGPLEDPDTLVKPAELSGVPKYKAHIHGPAQGLTIGDKAKVKQALGISLGVLAKEYHQGDRPV